MSTVYKYPIIRNPDEFTKSISGGKQMTGLRASPQDGALVLQVALRR